MPDPLSKLYSTLTTGELCHFIGDEMVDHIATISGRPITSTSLSEILAHSAGTAPLSSQQLRAKLAQSGTRVFGPPPYMKFSWGDNAQTRAFLDHYSIPLGHLEDQASCSQPASSLVSPPKTLFDYQLHAKDRIQATLAPLGARALLHFPTGAGKTRTAIEAAIDHLRGGPDRTVCWLAHTDELCSQAAEAFFSLWERKGDRPANLIRLWGSQCNQVPPCGTTIAVTSFQTVHSWVTSSKDKSFSAIAQLRNRCSLLIIDEAHLCLAPSYQKAMAYLTSSSTRRLGLSATPGRQKWGSGIDLTHLVAEQFNFNKIEFDAPEGSSSNPISFLQKEGILANISTRRLATDLDYSLSSEELITLQAQLEFPPELLTNLGHSKQRNAIIFAQIRKLCQTHKRILVFVASVFSAKLLAAVSQIQGIEATSVDAQLPKRERRQRISQFEQGKIQAMFNMGVLTTGFDVPGIDAVVIARPTLSVVLYSQMIGRGIRGPRVGGTSNCLIVDVVDNFANLPNYQEAFQHFDNAWT
jgi:DNA repair protein RadD